MSVIPPELDGAVIPGGCDTCEAEQRMRQERPDIWFMTVVHDDDCPTWRHIQEKRTTEER